MGRNSQHKPGSQPGHDTGKRLDDQREHEESGLLQGGHGSRAEEWRDPQPSAEGEPEVSWNAGTQDQRSTPPGMTNEDVEQRSEIARFLGKGVWPADRDVLIATARENNATDRVLADLGRLPDGEQFANVQDVARALGIGTEAHGY